MFIALVSTLFALRFSLVGRIMTYKSALPITVVMVMVMVSFALAQDVEEEEETFSPAYEQGTRPSKTNRPYVLPW